MAGKGKSGERLAVIPPYGYRKDPGNPKQLVVDEERAAVVHRISRLSMEGYGPAQIARLLNDEHILNPSGYKYEHGIVKKARPCKDPYFWNTTTVHKLLDAPEYPGLTINFKTWSKFYKDSLPRLDPPEKQLVFEDTHPAIIDLETWDIVRSMRQHKRRAPRYGNPGLFSGVAYCAGCGAKLYFLPGQSRTHGERATRVFTVVPNTARTYSICRNWSNITPISSIWWTNGICWTSSRKKDLPDESAPTVTPEPTPAPSSEPSSSPATQEPGPQNNAGGIVAVLLIVAVIAVGAFCFFKFRNPKQSAKGKSDLDDYDFGEDESDDAGDATQEADAETGDDER